jgi:hypothetical protein
MSTNARLAFAWDRIGHIADLNPTRQVISCLHDALLVINDGNRCVDLAGILLYISTLLMTAADRLPR